MAFAQIEDLQGSVELVIFPNVWEETMDLWQPERILIVRGQVSFRDREPSILVDSATNELTTVDTPPGEPAPRTRAGKEPVHLHVTIPRSIDMERTIRRLGHVYEVLASYPGDDRFSLYVENGGRGRIQIQFPNNTTGHCVELEQKLRDLLGAGTLQVEPLARETVLGK